MRKGRGSTETVNTPCPELFAAPLVMHNVQCFISKKKQTKNTTAVSTSFISITVSEFIFCDLLKVRAAHWILFPVRFVQLQNDQVGLPFRGRLCPGLTHRLMQGSLSTSLGDWSLQQDTEKKVISLHEIRGR